MQYYIHSHGFGDDNRRCVALLLKGLRHLAYHPEQDRAVMPQSPPMPADHTRVVGGADFLHRSLPRPLLAPGSGSLPSPIPGGRRPQAGDPNAGQWRRLAGGQVVTIEPHMQVQLVSKLGLNEFDYFLFADHRVVQINLHTGQGRWSLFTNRHELSYFQHGYYKPTMPQGDGINDLAQLAKAIGYSKFYLKDEAWDRIKELTSKESLAMLGVFASVWVGSQFTPVGWAADALVLVLTIGGCILLGPHLLEVGSLLESFYKKATNAGRNEAQYRSAGKDFAKVVTLVGVDVLMVLVFHVAKAPVNRLVVRVKQGGVGKLPGAKPVPVEESVPAGEGKGKGETESNVDGPSRTQPSGKPDPNAKPRGPRAKQSKNDKDPANKRSAEGEDRAADVLAENGYDVEQKRPPSSSKNPGEKSADFDVEGKPVDCVTPGENTSIRNVWERVRQKADVAKQTERVVINLEDWNGDVAALKKQFADWPIKNLKEVIIITTEGTVKHIFP